MSDKIEWTERVNAISVNPHMTTIDDIARMAADLQEYIMAEMKACQPERPGITLHNHETQTTRLPQTPHNA